MSQDTSNALDTVIGGGAVNTVDATQALQDAKQHEQDGNRLAAIEALRSIASSNDEAAFRLAYHLDLVGEEDEAVSLYEDLVRRQTRPSINVMLNLAVILEDRGDINGAERCLRQILDTEPNHERARLFMMDVRSSKDMYYDEEQARDMAKRNALLDTPVTDFELSVRARNCLKKMQIRTLGDLLKVSESELLSYKNFGETSLVEINQMLTSKGLRLGQSLQSHYSRMRQEIYDEIKGKASEAVLNKPITQLDFSVRARKALQLLGVHTVGDLATRTEAELMGVKNFGATSLDEVNDVLQSYNLDLRTLE
ncbi:MAG: DNA-directed RNA polymerase subunit alpha C-terminal domain-containing protein [Phycisphaerales bacterium]|nr:DNA-directed RNA polymerase subunit alpha C-terminal domain-containing protein [Phycisphaerales bacterium]